MNELNVKLSLAPGADPERAERLRALFPMGEGEADGLTLELDGEGLSLRWEDQVLRGDFARLLPRLRGGVSGELLVRAAKIKNLPGQQTVLDATAGLGEDSFLLAAAGFRVKMYERNPVIGLLLADALERAGRRSELAEIAGRMELVVGDSIEAMKELKQAPDVILLDPMFPERQKSALVKKKLQIIQKLEIPCNDERELLATAMAVGARRLVIKRPPKGPWLAGFKPDYSIQGKAVRFDCVAAPADKLNKLLAGGK
ncbi:MAG: class I SAM-dependent methyltransferase [Oscillospiraceae bacterium]|nr:class I SAM-dependent methyltransferase [Oscillospiraceae bacterium]